MVHSLADAGVLRDKKCVTALKRFALVVITGGSSGIGYEFLKTIVTVGESSRICNLSRKKPEGFPALPGHHHIPCDVANSTSLADAVKTIFEIAAESPPGPVLLINNSGFGTMGEFPAPSVGRACEMIDVNVAAPVRLAGLLWPLLLKRGGQIVNIASISAFQPTPVMAVYGGTKAFLLHWSVALDVEARRHGIRALAVCPGTTRTKFFDVAGAGGNALSGVVQTPEQVVRETFRAMARGKTIVVCGFANKLAMFFAARLPKLFTARAACATLKKRV